MKSWRVAALWGAITAIVVAGIWNNLPRKKWDDGVGSRVPRRPDGGGRRGQVAGASVERWGKAGKLSEEPLQPRFEVLKPLYELKRAPQGIDWLRTHSETPQTFADFVYAKPEKPSPSQQVIVIQPLGALGRGQQQIITLVADYMGRFFGLPIRIAEPLPESAIPKEIRRVHPTLRIPQLLTSGTIKLLRPQRPRDAFAYLILTAEDLYPAADWNFVFGEAFPEERMGIWSLARYGDPDESPEAFQLCLARTMKVASHEMTHLLGVDHCEAYECAMNGSNSLPETDESSHFLCPTCMQKLVTSTGVDPVARMKSLQEFYAAHGFADEARFAGRNLMTWAAGE